MVEQWGYQRKAQRVVRSCSVPTFYVLPQAARSTATRHRQLTVVPVEASRQSSYWQGPQRSELV
jgi:hypothetical protein